MKVTAESLPERQVRLKIEVDEERQAQAIEQAYKKLAPRVRIRGFRPGKAPRPMIERELGHHRLVDEANDALMNDVYRQALEEQELTPVAQPTDVQVETEEPLVFTATVPLQPVVDLGDYQAMRLAKDEVTVDEAQVEETLTGLRRQYGTIEPVERAAQKGDRISGSLHVEVEGAVIYDDPEIEFRLTDETLSSLPGLADAVVGMTAGEEKTTEATLPEDFNDSRYAGKSASYLVKVGEVKEEKLADLDDAFAQQVGEGFTTVQTLRDRIREDSTKAANDAAQSKLETEALDALVAQASAEYPAVLVDHEIDHILEDQANLEPRSEEAQRLYLQRLGKSEAEVRDTVREEAQRRLVRSLVLSQFAEAENITIGDEDLDSEVETMLEGVGEQGEALRGYFRSETARESLRRSLLTRRTLERLSQIVGGEAPAAAAEPEAKAPARRTTKRPRSGPRAAADETSEEPEAEAEETAAETPASEA